MTYVDALRFQKKFDELPPLPADAEAPTPESLKDERFRARAKGDWMITDAKFSRFDDKDAVAVKLLFRAFGEDNEYTGTIEEFMWIPNALVRGEDKPDGYNEWAWKGSKASCNFLITLLSSMMYGVLTDEEQKADFDELMDACFNKVGELKGRIINSEFEWSAYYNKDGDLKGPYFGIRDTSMYPRASFVSKLDTGEAQTEDLPF